MSVAAAAPCDRKCQKRVKAKVYAKSHGGCYSRVCTLRVRAKHDARAIRALTPYRCSFGRSAIPCVIVHCESNGKWTALNPSGAAGRYQLMPVHNRPWPVNTRHARLRHHQIASRLYRASGAGPWTASRHCWG